MKIPSVPSSYNQLLKWLRWLLSFSLLAIIVYVAPIKEIGRSLLLINPFIVVSAMFLVIVNLCLRGARWALLFYPHYHITGLSASGPVMIGLAVNGILPGRVGELVRIILGVRKFKSGFTFTTATVIGDRMLDGLTLLLFFGTSMLLLPHSSTGTSENIIIRSVSSQTVFHVFRSLSIISFVLLFSVIGLMFLRKRLPLEKIVRCTPVIGLRIGDWAEKVIGEASRGFEAFRYPWVLFRSISLSLIIWLSLALCTYLVALGMSDITLNFLQALVITSISVAASSIPAAPGAWGVFEAGTLLAIKLLNIPCETSVGVAFAFILHFCTYTSVVFMGIIAVMRSEITVSELNSVIQSSASQQLSGDDHRSENKANVSSPSER